MADTKAINQEQVERKYLVIDIFRGTTHDGPGMRTTVFLKGCPLNCLWCQNPEGIKYHQEVWWDEKKCIGCYACKEACPNDAIIFDENGLHIDSAKCVICGTCTVECPAQAISFTGKEWNVDQMVKEALKDKDYYETFSGGVTVSGGEPLSQYSFVEEFFKKLKEHGVHTALDTCGLASVEALDSVLPYTDYVLFDIKLIDPESHMKFTGQTNRIILDNLKHIAEYIRSYDNGMKIWIRTPLIPEATATAGNLADIGSFILENIIDVVERWELCSFNNACKSKYKKMGKIWAYENYRLMGQDVIDTLKAAALSTGFPEDRLLISGLIAKGDAKV